jgi:hypothetical protein
MNENGSQQLSLDGYISAPFTKDSRSYSIPTICLVDAKQSFLVRWNDQRTNVSPDKLKVSRQLLYAVATVVEQWIGCKVLVYSRYIGGKVRGLHSPRLQREYRRLSRPAAIQPLAVRTLAEHRVGLQSRSLQRNSDGFS